MSETVIVTGNPEPAPEAKPEVSAQEELAETQLKEHEKAKTEELVNEKVDEKLEWTHQDIENHRNRLDSLEAQIAVLESRIAELKAEEMEPEPEPLTEPLLEIPAQSNLESDEVADLEPEPYHQKFHAL
jgi:chromosome segregation ATPase